MMPPCCDICGEDFDPGKNADIIYFKLTEEDEEWSRKMNESSMVGHPPYAKWFCEEHYPEAKKLENKTTAEAMKILREKFK